MTSSTPTPHPAHRVSRAVTERRAQARAARSWGRALHRATTPAALAEIEFLHDRVR